MTLEEVNAYYLLALSEYLAASIEHFSGSNPVCIGPMPKSFIKAGNMATEAINAHKVWKEENKHK